MNFYLYYSLHWLWLFVVIIPFAVLYYKLVERPWIKLGDRLRNRQQQPMPVAPVKEEERALVKL